VIIGRGAVALTRPERAVYREFPVPPALRSSVCAIWQVEVAEGDSWLHPVLPDGYTDAIVTPSMRIVVHGPVSKGDQQPLPAGTVVTGARLRPGSMTRLVDVRADEARDRAIDVGELDTGSTDSGDVVSALSRFLAGLSGELPYAQQQVLRACTMLAQSPSAGSVRQVADEISVSERLLRHAFAGQVGLSPKLFHQVRRFQKALRLAATGRQGGLAQVALDAGYADQAHFTRECRALSGTTPARLLRAAGCRFVQDRGTPQSA
jgi:AraC-like DNA-binding protein